MLGVLSRGDLLDATEATWDRCLTVNAEAVFFLSQAFARRLRARARPDALFHSIVNVTSSNASAVAVQRSEYCASKAAEAMVSKALAVRLGPESISVYDVQPGLIATEMTAQGLDLGIAEAMDTAQRGMGLEWPGALQLIRRTKAELPDALVANGCGTDHPDPADVRSLADVIRACMEPLEAIQNLGGRIILMAFRAGACGAGGLTITSRSTMPS